MRKPLLKLLLAAAGCVLLCRGLKICLGGNLRDGVGEKRWFAWAYRDPKAADVFYRMRDSLRPSETISIVIPAGKYDPGWCHVMASYYLPRQMVVAVKQGTPEMAFQNRTTTVFLTENGRIWIRRPHRTNLVGDP